MPPRHRPRNVPVESSSPVPVYATKPKRYVFAPPRLASILLTLFRGNRAQTPSVISGDEVPFEPRRQPGDGKLLLTHSFCI